MRQALIINFDYPIGGQSLNWGAGCTFRELQNAGLIAADAELRGAGQHALAHRAFNQRCADLLAFQIGSGRNPGGQYALADIGSTTYHLYFAAYVDGDKLVLTLTNGFIFEDAGDTDRSQMSAESFDAFAFGGPYGDQAFQFGCRQGDSTGQFRDPATRKQH